MFRIPEIKEIDIVQEHPQLVNHRSMMYEIKPQFPEQEKNQKKITKPALQEDEFEVPGQLYHGELSYKHVDLVTSNITLFYN